MVNNNEYRHIIDRVLLINNLNLYRFYIIFFPITINTQKHKYLLNFFVEMQLDNESEPKVVISKSASKA